MNIHNTQTQDYSNSQLGQKVTVRKTRHTRHLLVYFKTDLAEKKERETGGTDTPTKEKESIALYLYVSC